MTIFGQFNNVLNYNSRLQILQSAFRSHSVYKPHDKLDYYVCMAEEPPRGSYAIKYACMHVCMHVCMYACMHVCMYACMHVCMYACMHVCMHACMHVCMYAGMYVCMYIIELFFFSCARLE